MSERADWGTIHLGDLPYPVIGEVSTTPLSAFPQPVTFGAADKNSMDEVLGAWIVGPDLTGGGQVWDANEGSDQNRYWDGTIDTTRASGIAPPPETVVTRPTGVPNTAIARPLGVIGASAYMAFDAACYAWDETNDAWLHTSTTLPAGNVLAAPPYGKDAVLFEGWVYVPQGNDAAGKGYQRLKETTAGTLTVENGPTGGGEKIQAVSFCEWDNKLFVVETDGVLSFTVTGEPGSWRKGGALDAAGNKKRKLQASQVPTHLVEFTNRQGAPTLFLVTKQGVFSYYADAERLEKTPLTFPPHPDVGLGVAVWRPGEDLFVSAGLEIHRWTANNVRSALSAALSRDSGLPAALAGRVVDLEPEQSLLFALLAGNPTTTTDESAVVEGPGSGTDDAALFPDDVANNAIYVHGQHGWCRWWLGEPSTAPPTWAKVGSIYGQTDSYRLWWGVGPDAHTMRISRATLNTREELNRGERRYATSGVFLETVWFDAAMASFWKKAARAVVRADRASEVETLTVSYRTKPSAGWTQLGVVDGAGEDEDETPLELDPDGDGYPEGLRFKRIQLRVDWGGSAANPTKAAILDALVLHFRKIPQRVTSHSFSVALPTEPWGGGRDGRQMWEELQGLLDAPTFPRFVHQRGANNAGAPMRVDVTGLTKTGATGDDFSGIANVTVVEIVQQAAAGEAA